MFLVKGVVCNILGDLKRKLEHSIKMDFKEEDVRVWTGIKDLLWVKWRRSLGCLSDYQLLNDSVALTLLTLIYFPICSSVEIRRG